MGSCSQRKAEKKRSEVSREIVEKQWELLEIRKQNLGAKPLQAPEPQAEVIHPQASPGIAEAVQDAEKTASALMDRLINPGEVVRQAESVKLAQQRRAEEEALILLLMQM